jgi:predicted peroxiredoxin
MIFYTDVKSLISHKYEHKNYELLINRKFIISQKDFTKTNFVIILTITILFILTFTPIIQSHAVSSSNYNKTKLVYHLSSDEPWRATVALSDSQTMLKMGYNVTLMLSIEGVQLGVKQPHSYLGLDRLTNNVTNFIINGGNVIVCEICLKIAGYNNSDIIDGAVVGTPQIMSNLLNRTTVVDY